MITLKCDCCHFQQDFATFKEAFLAGWDCPPLFEDYVACNLCPAAFIVTGEKWKHDLIHLEWAKSGRPGEFSTDTCLRPEDRPPGDDWQEQTMGMIFEALYGGRGSQ